MGIKPNEIVRIVIAVCVGLAVLFFVGCVAYIWISYNPFKTQFLRWKTPVATEAKTGGRGRGRGRVRAYKRRSN